MEFINLYSLIGFAQSSLLKRERFLNWLMINKPELVEKLLVEYQQHLESKKEPKLLDK